MVTWSKDQSLRLWAPYQETQYRCGVDEEELDSESLSGESDEEACDALDQATEAFEEEGQAETEAVKKRVEFADICILEGRKGEKRLESPVKEHSPESTVENTLQQEFALLDTSNFNFLNVTELDLEKRVARVVATTAHSRLLLLASFPPTYPVAVSPVFTFLKGSTMNPAGKTRILRSLQETAQQQVRRNRACLERCLRQLEFQLEQMNQEAVVEDEATKNSFPFVRAVDYLNAPSPFQDSSIPYPRTSGSRFCSNGLLVCFGRPAYQIQVGAGAEAGLTPRAYSAYLSTVCNRSEQDLMKPGGIRAGGPRFPGAGLQHSLTPGQFSEQGVREELVQGVQMQNVGGIQGNLRRVPALEGVPGVQGTIRRGRFKVKRVPSGAQEDGFLRSKRSNMKKGNLRQPKDIAVALKVTVYNISKMLPISRELAARYVVLEDPVAMCKANAEVADELGNSELARIWQLASQVASAAGEIGEENEQGGWANCPMGRPLLKSLLSHHLQCKDFQTVALLICAFTKQTIMKPPTPLKSPQEPLPQLARDKFWFLKSGALTGTTPGGLGDSPYHTVHR